MKYQLRILLHLPPHIPATELLLRFRFLSFSFLSFFSTFCSLFTARLFSFLCTIMGKRKQLESNFLLLEVRWSNSWKQINGLLLGGLCTAKVSWLLWMNSGDNPQSFRAQSAVLLLTVKSRKIISFSKQSSVHQLPFFVLALKSFKREMHEMILRAAWLTLRVSQPLHNVTGNCRSNNLPGWCLYCVSFGFGETAIKFTLKNYQRLFQREDKVVVSWRSMWFRVHCYCACQLRVLY